MIVDCWKFNQNANSEKITIDNPKEFLRDKYVKGCIFGLDNLKCTGYYKFMGWCYDFRPFLKNFVYKQYGRWIEVYVPNKTCLRKVVCGRIDKILEVL